MGGSEGPRLSRFQLRPGGVIFERQVLGEWARLAAVDELTGLEVVVIGPAAAPPAELERVALAKLRRRLADGEEGPGPPGGAGAPPQGRRGRLV